MSIAFTQYLRPDGRPRPVLIDRPADVEAAAARFVAAGGKYECEELATGEVALTAVLTLDEKEGPKDVASEVCANGPPVLEAVDSLVRVSLKHIKREQSDDH